ncbi:subtilisin-like protein [Coniophora puteana RWD-64-598 SS2]|uniref:tripeptidyl-peptidase II n=1 Tax=Coniophora puteana (strain RWD-64-598) TaxID=741705 RepID=A0A5M3MBM0_CONPW|nr:subtilisin-like protein [Coniophora puteana RWD-64-598 SS2]EIW76473.1 subtilisin-like protein [Coniophora puteana RWD-64-598 SS2]
MRTTRSFIALLSLVLAATAAPRPGPKPFKGCDHKVFESIESPPAGWAKHTAAPHHELIQLQIALSQPRFGELEDHLLQISDPSHARYGMHLSKEEVHELMAPHPDSHDLLVEWLVSHGLDESAILRSSANDMVTVSVPVNVAEAMFDTELHVYKHAETGEGVIRTTSYSLPEILHDHIELVHPLTMYTSMKPLRSKVHYADGAIQDIVMTLASNNFGPRSESASSAIDPSCNYQITPSCLRQMYNIGNYTPSATNGNAIGVTAFINNFANFDDFHKFLELQVPAAAGGGANFSVVSISGGMNNQTNGTAGSEADLDVEYAYGLTYPTPGTFYPIAGAPTANWVTPFLDFVDYALNQTDVPQVISTSYGQDENTIPQSYANRFCKGVAALGARGVSMISGSGDFGVAGLGAEFGNDTQPGPFLMLFPASCPYMTAVGATQGIEEVAANFTQFGGYTGGGFSNYFPRPSYQDAAVQPYLEYLGDQYEGLYNKSGRGFPDVAAQGVNYLIVNNTIVSNISGTSAATPTFASIVSMLNDARIEANMSTLGFLNPFLYSQGLSALQDITKGNNPGRGTPGFNATKGWDPLTGLGTPDFGKLKDLVLASNSTL